LIAGQDAKEPDRSFAGARRIAANIATLPELKA